jgi:hypothetical protein
MTADPVPPIFLSLEFHTRFFPQLLINRYLRRKKKGDTPDTTFTSTTEMFLLVAVCAILAAIGLPSALSKGSTFGWVLSVVGIGGMIALVIQSVAAGWGIKPSYDDFLVGIFLFFVSLGFVAGVAAGLDAHSASVGIPATVAGVAVGYAVGILAGLRMQHLGWIAIPLNMLAGLGAVIVAGGALVVLVAV